MNPLLSILSKNIHSLRNLGRLLRREPVFKTLFILCFAVGMIVGFFILFRDGFRVLEGLGPGSALITRRLFALFYFSLGAMLITSSVVTSYSTLFRSRETEWLMTAPIDVRDLVTYKSIESALLSSWAFFFLVVPFAAAYAMHEKLGPLFALWTLVYSVPFVLLCSGLGTLVSLAAVRWLPRRRAFWIALAGLGVAALVRLLLQARPAPQDEESFVLNRLLPGLQMATHALLPNWWAAEGIMALSRGQVWRGCMYWTVLTTSMLTVGLLIQGLGTATFLTSWQRLGTSGGNRRRPAELLRWLDRALGRLPHDIRGLVLKDLRSFLRDPLQWSQALIFFGLLALYFSSFRSFRYNQLPEQWRILIVFLNIFSVASVICSLASRFVFPQLSLEGHSFWVIGLAPTSMRRVLLTKFAAAAVAMVSISTVLMTLAVWMLQVEPLLRVVAIGVALCIALGVTALSVGLGAVFIDLKQSNPVAVISGFGGTLNLVLSLGFMLSVILPFGIVWYANVRGRVDPQTFLRVNLGSAVWLVLLTVLITAIPLVLGSRSLNRREY
jgi:ABC-2 type transport system permease protein